MPTKPTVLDTTDIKTREERITAQLDELNRWQQVTMGREQRILELKAEVNDLLQQFDLPPRYNQEGDETE